MISEKMKEKPDLPNRFFPRQRVFRQRHVDTDRFRLIDRCGNENGNAGAVVDIGHDPLQR